ncbi:DNA-binding transcriptional activator EvgA [Serratia fonticola]|uniref:DNA-binding transcriptional activator EvgA n=1 Tax=Serratia fonticola TaxID=47917 RepID=A0A0F7HCL6_SERFO|nr:LuxR C-terminal-related transcriptional regulator [Serratia fonticola]AKG69863.1 hypothetical protein WN53_12490 [Serratia fonticola]CAI1635484.1 DNA-binding transcriptional activator EvgA [Serratia fonticola]VTR57414.1 DNA-binding transcriptional activator EvgA [Serratia fonticola]
MSLVLSNDFMVKRNILLNDGMTWPNANRYFHEGVVSYFDSIGALLDISDVVFVDFQLSNLFALLEQKWVLYFVGVRIILITDSHLLPLANYYKGMFNHVDLVIQVTGTSKSFFNKLEHVMSGGEALSSSNDSLSSRDIYLLRKSLHGMTIRDIADKLQLSPKGVYTMRHRVLQKMGLTRMKDIYMQTANSYR